MPLVLELITDKLQLPTPMEEYWVNNNNNIYYYWSNYIFLFTYLFSDDKQDTYYTTYLAIRH